MNKNKATLILIVVTIGYLITYPFKNIFILGLLSSGFCAAMIGGFADWYGITALFRKPLGIPWKTEIIARSRKKIFDGLTDMVVGELITEDNMKGLITDQNFSDIIIKYWDEGMEKQIKSFMKNAIDEVFIGLNNEQNQDEIEKIIISNINKVSLHKILITTSNIFVQNDYGDKLFDFLIEEVYKISGSPVFEQILIEAVDHIKDNYENGMLRRKFVNYIVLDTLLNMSSQNIVNKLIVKIKEYINSLKDSDNLQRQSLKKMVYDKITVYLENPEHTEVIENWKVKQLKNLEIKNFIQKFYDKFNDASVDTSDKKQIMIYIEKNVDLLAGNFRNKEDWKENTDIKIKKYLLASVSSAHKVVERLVRDNLNNYSDKMLVNLVETKAGNDLQLIRINGSVVGGLVGMLAFLISYFIG
ncbi:DUF445 domain-containing protein [Clostridium oryzae]|uniref:DUF445 domain-containing protein n=1 Tax=Clostridium oryzae TaxID=1450648 RepID=A0A1V4I758_9CLOT|nr:DUF445 domain-containing protein [Clostridium oryzae]OPJ55719.1 hypothetical protein CLORY_43650 [Clostridium oryzae]